MPITPTAAAAHASTDPGFGLFRSTRPGYNLYMHVPRWVTISLSLTAIGLVPWTLWLTFSLPSRHVTDHYDLAWVGFDIALLFMLAWTAWTAFRRSPVLSVSAAMTAMMLLVDAWFDVVTAPSVKELALSLPMALVVELPLAAVCIWLARNGQRIAERLVVIRLRRRRRARAR